MARKQACRSISFGRWEARLQEGYTVNQMVDFRPAAPQEARMDPDDRPSGNDSSDLDLIFAALADRTRRALLAALITGDRSVGDLAVPHRMSLAAISKHIQILVRAGLVAQVRSGRVVTCRALPDGPGPRASGCRASGASTSTTTTRWSGCWSRFCRERFRKWRNDGRPGLNNGEGPPRGRRRPNPPQPSGPAASE
jgi:DNA-binding transcriptional ArsR family regulator